MIHKQVLTTLFFERAVYFLITTWNFINITHESENDLSRYVLWPFLLVTHGYRKLQNCVNLVFIFD